MERNSLATYKTMMFRKLYWVTEQVEPGRCPRVTGVYTSIPDLIRCGLRWIEPTNGHCRLRLTLVKLDSDKGPLAEWQSPDFESLVSDLEPFVRTDEFRAEEVHRLAEALDGFVKVAASED